MDQAWLIKLCEIEGNKDLEKGASNIPGWVNYARLCGDRVRMFELDYWINYTNRVPYNRKLKTYEWEQVKVFNLPKRSLKLQVEPEHLDVFLSTVKYIKPRKDHRKCVDLSISDLEGNVIIRLINIYGRIDFSNLSEHFELKRAAEYKTFDEAFYKFKNKYEIYVSNCYFNENQ